jgi:hypothetical protein
VGKNRNKLRNQAANSNPLKGQSGTVFVQPPVQFCLNFSPFDPTQGQTLEDWNNDGLLIKAFHKWREQCKKTIIQCIQEKGFAIYGHIPNHSEFTRPTHVPEDAQWASMHIQGGPCVIGHVIGNVFYVVFLDKHHKFWPVDKKNT